MPTKKKTVAKNKAVAKAKASASNRTNVVVNVAAPARRKAAPRKKPVTAPTQSANLPPTFYFNHSTPLFSQNHAHELAQLAALQGIRQDLAAIKPAPALVTATNPVFDVMTPPPTPVEAAEDAFARGLPSPADPIGQRLPRRETMFDPAGGPLLAASGATDAPRTRPAAGSPGTVRNPLTGAAITVGGKRYKELVKSGKIFKE